MGVFAAAMTAFYSWRVMFMTFHGTTRADHHTFEHAHEAPKSMMIPLYVLAAGAALAGMLGYRSFVGSGQEAFWGMSIFTGAGNLVLEHAEEVPKLVKASPFLAMLVGAGLAWLMYVRYPDAPRRLAESQRPLYLFLLNKWYFDEIYDWLFVRPAKRIGRFLWRRGDDGAIDGAIYGVAMGVVPLLTRLSARAQSGYMFHYAFAMLIGVSFLVTWFAVAGGAE
jgi:NADH-quinone oxidoreductase subunit L